MIFTCETGVHVSVYWRKSTIFRSMKNSGLCYDSISTIWIQFSLALKHYHVYYEALKSLGNLFQKTYLPPLCKTCDFGFTSWSLQISTVSLNIHRSLKLKHFWKEKNVNFHKHALILEYIEYILWIIENTDVKLILEDSI